MYTLLQINSKENFGSSKDTVKQYKKAIHRRKYLQVMYLIGEQCQEQMENIKNSTTKPDSKQTKELDRYFSKEDT